MLIEADGWLQVRQKGSHRQFHHPSKPGTVTVSGKPSVDVPPGTLERFEASRREIGGVVMRYMVVVEQGPNSFGAYVPDLPGCVAVGSSKQEVLQLIQEAIEFHLEGIKDTGASVPQPYSYSEFIEVHA